MAPFSSSMGATAPWAELSLALRWAYTVCPPQRRIRATGLNLSLWHLARGSVSVHGATGSIQARAGQWVVCRPGERHQQFDASARILSIHLGLSTPTLATEWRGPSALVLDEDTKLHQHARRLMRSQAVHELGAFQELQPEEPPLPFLTALELRERVAALAARLFFLLAQGGMHYGIAPIRDERVRASRLALAASPLGAPFSRDALAAAQGLSPSQLDRLWRKELGLTPRQFHEARRLHAARAALHGEGESLKEIAYRLGFSHPSRFSNWFRTHHAETPRTFRERHRQGWAA